MILYDCARYIRPVYTAQAVYEVLCCYCTVLMRVIRIAEGWVDIELDETAELLLTQTRI